MPTYFCVRVYANGEARYSMRDDAGMNSWLSYNRQFRPGNALFVDGHLPDPSMDHGYLGEGEVALVSERLVAEMEQMGPQEPWKIAYDPSEGRRIYPERHWPRFVWPQPAEALAVGRSR